MPVEVGNIAKDRGELRFKVYARGRVFAVERGCSDGEARRTGFMKRRDARLVADRACYDHWLPGSLADGGDELPHVLIRRPICEEIETMHPVPVGKFAGAGRNLLYRAFQHAWMPSDPAGERVVMQAGPLEDGQHLIDARAPKQDIDADLDRRMG